MKFTDAVAVAGTRRTADGHLIAEAKSVAYKGTKDLRGGFGWLAKED